MRTIMMKQIGPVDLEHIPIIPDLNDPINMVQGFLKRVAHRQIPIEPVIKQRFINHVGTIIKSFEPLPQVDLNMKLFDDWIVTRDDYNGIVRERYRLIWQNLIDCNFNIPDKDYVVKVFPKSEFYSEVKFVRCICPRKEIVRIPTSIFTHMIEKEVFYGHLKKYFIKGRDIDGVINRMQEIQSKYSNILETDYSSFEGSFTEEYFDIVEKRLWRHMLRNNPLILKIFLKCYGKQHYSCFAFKATMVGSRKSGDSWTSLANSFSNYVNMSFLCSLYGLRWDGIFEGDDGFCAISSPSLTSEHYRMLGFTIKIKYCNDINQVDFCGICYDPRNKHLIPRFNLMSKLGWTCNAQHFNYGPKKRRDLRESKLLSALCLSRGCPINQNLIVSSLASRDTKKKYLVDSWTFNNFMGRYVSYNPDWIKPVQETTRMIYEDKNCISREMQIFIEKRGVQNEFFRIP